MYQLVSGEATTKVFLVSTSCQDHQLTHQGCIQKFCQRGANLGYGQKRGGGSLCEVLHPILARGGGGGGGENDTRGVKCLPPLIKYSPAHDLICQLARMTIQLYSSVIIVPAGLVPVACTITAGSSTDSVCVVDRRSCLLQSDWA